MTALNELAALELSAGKIERAMEYSSRLVDARARFLAVGAECTAASLFVPYFSRRSCRVTISVSDVHTLWPVSWSGRSGTCEVARLWSHLWRQFDIRQDNAVISI
jgi:hypothetical protein